MKVDLTIAELAAIIDAMNCKDLSYANQVHIDDYTSAKNKLINTIKNEL